MFFNASNRSFDDRFIPNRKYSNLDLSHYKLLADDSKIKTDIFCMKSKQLNRYQELLQDTLNYDDSPIYSFTTQPKQCKREKKCLKRQWPCIPRKHRMVWKRDIVLDWPISRDEIDWNIIDWGSNGYIATIWNERVYLWHNELLKTATQEEVTSTGISGLSVRWSHKSTYLAVSGNYEGVKIYAFPSLKLIGHYNCHPHIAFETCSISAICWDRRDNVVISGCSKGTITTFGLRGDDKCCIIAHPGFRVLKLEINSNNKFVCSSGTDGLIRVWTWPKLEPHLEITYGSAVRAVAFHPWQPSLLCVGGGLGDGSLSLWNVVSGTQVAHHVPVRASMVDCLTWNPVTGELISSHYILAPEGTGVLEDLEPIEGITKVLVLSGFDDVLDYVEECEGRMLYLMWDKTGTKLATACSDETLCIFNFLGSDSNRNIISKTKKTSVLSRLEKCIR